MKPSRPSPTEPSPTVPPPYLRTAEGSVVISVKAQPRAHRTEIAGRLGDALKVKVAAPPVDSAANEALVEFLAEKLGCARRSVVLIRGQSSTHKQVAVRGMTIGQVAEALGG